MTKYKIQCGALVSKLMQRTFTVSANNEDEAIQKAKDRFDRACSSCRTYTEQPATINIDNIEIVE